jgi:hypothetical protein
MSLADCSLVKGRFIKRDVIPLPDLHGSSCHRLDDLIGLSVASNKSGNVLFLNLLFQVTSRKARLGQVVNLTVRHAVFLISIFPEETRINPC